ncbi:hypothetical protein AAHC03_012929 [Spirometra sp. Aus1]
MSSGGREVQHIKQSDGGEAFLHNHYVTTNMYTYGSYWNGFKPTFKTFEGAGYVTNNRPVVQYCTELDRIDNPAMIEELRCNYVTTNQATYVPYGKKHGKEQLPPGTYQPRESIFFLKSINSPPTQQGPGLWSTQYSTDYVPKKQATAPLDPSRMGRKELSGFCVNNKTAETLSGRPDCCFAESGPSWLTPRRTSNSVYQVDFQPYGRRPIEVNEGGPATVMSDGFILNNKVQQDFVPRRTDKVFVKAEELPYGKLDKLKKTDRAEYWNAYNASRYPSITHDEYKYPPHEERMKVPDASESELKKRESTGTIRNIPPVLDGLPCAPDHFVTHNMTTYYWTAPREGSDRQGCVNMNTLDIQPSGFVLGTKLNAMEPQTEAIKRLPELSNYQGKSVVAREEISTAPTKMLA